MDDSEAFVRIALAAISAPIETTLADLLGALTGTPTLSIEAVEKLEKKCALFQLEVVPNIVDGDLSRTRIVRRSLPPVYGHEQLEIEIQRGEGASLELKSSFEFDHKRRENDPGAPIDQLRSSKVRHSFLKTIAAFLNTGGGVLIAGVTDHGSIVGVGSDFAFLRAGRQDIDNWLLHVLDCIKSAFLDGATVADYVTMAPVHCPSEQIVVRVQVASRERLSFLLDESRQYRLYRRQGNKTEEVLIQHVEDFLEYRRGRIPRLN